MLLATLDLLARWLHIIGVLIWMGHNYANVVQNPVYRPVRADDSGALQGITLAAMKREHGTFRYASLVALGSGLFMLWYRGLLPDALTLSGPGRIIGIGVWSGTLMVLNLWLVLWPHQKKVLGFVPARPEERVRCSRITFLASRTNTILSLPTLFFMLAGSHGGFLFL
ncbi:MAG TPA: urate hydroxylase PuuD [Candidatus Competibacteraceae bacterium]|nr:urate hydroxylase PuuD [Candidatus Competibacteraceae bacterium]